MFKWVVRVLVGCILVGVALLMATFWIGNRVYREDPRPDTRTTVRIIRIAIEQWQAANNQVTCPTLEVLISEKQLDPDQPTTDPWQHPFRMQCTPDEVTVSSSGPDGMFGTADDIAVPHDAQQVVK